VPPLTARFLCASPGSRVAPAHFSVSAATRKDEPQGGALPREGACPPSRLTGAHHADVVGDLRLRVGSPIASHGGTPAPPRDE
jgi:hypothetical protein